jgi:tetrahydromethanopterin S-methyltransferase subunit G
VGGLFSGLVAWVKKLLGIKSPSTVFITIGQDIMGGLVIGIEAGGEDLAESVRSVINDLTEIVKDVAGAFSKMAGSKIPSDIGAWKQAIIDMVVMVSEALNEAYIKANEAIKVAAGMRDRVLKVLDVAGKAVEAIADIAGVDAAAIQGAGSKWLYVEYVLFFIVERMASIASRMELTGLPAAEAFAESGGKVMELVAPTVAAVTALFGVDMEDLQGAGAKWLYVEYVLFYIVGRMSAIATRMDLTGYPAAAAFAESAGKIVALIEPSINAVVALTGVDTAAIQNVSEKWSWVITAVLIIAGNIVRMAATFDQNTARAAELFRKVTEDVLASIQAGLGVLTEVGESGGTGTVVGALEAFSAAVTNSMLYAVDAVRKGLDDITAAFANKQSQLYAAAYAAGSNIGKGIMAGMRAQITTGNGNTYSNTTQNSNTYNITQTGAAQSPNSLRTTVTALQMAGTA